MTNNTSVSEVSRNPSALAVIRSIPSARTSRTAARKLLSVHAATGYVGAAILGSAAVIEVARAWLSAPCSEAASFLGGSVVALFVLASIGLATRVKELGGIAIAAAFGLLVYGTILVLGGQSIGILFVGLAPISGVLTHIAFRHEPSLRDSIHLAWAIAKCRARAAQNAARVASRSPLATAA